MLTPSMPEPSRHNITFSLRAMSKADVMDVVGLIRDSYGDSYFYKQFYDPREIIHANQCGRLTSVVAVTGDNQLIGHMALLRTEDDPQIVEPVMAVVKTGFRNGGVLTGLAEYLYINRNPELFEEVKGIYIPPVTKHIFSQRQVYNHGFKDCGIWLGYLPDAQFKEINVSPLQRLTLVLTYMYLEQPGSIIIYPPPRHKEMIAKLFKNIGVPYVQCRLLPKDLQNYFHTESLLKVKVSNALGQAILKIIHYGPHVISEIHTKINELSQRNLSVIHLYLSLNNPLTGYLTPEFEKMGFFFAGIMPGTACNDTLILQYLNNTAVNYDKILLFSAMAQEILGYIIAKRNL
ncbi:acyl-coa n-acyltransferase [Lucifera butyrica]|uniref:Acyl-coa n-acyltransferase n=1 Tax=Lucifera butyrica TaxID=1351585 RepID=A0A498RDN2_9FIRM|nr:hypothetical protein [Lucifera butyrica]VBB07318.1 acyl-coa n-acyltransferase [Lucifera butyrica]